MIRARRRFGQHFLHDPGVIARIVAAIDPQPGDRIVEIGPGTGALTAPLLERCGRVEAIEIDRDLVAPLEQRCAGLGELVVHAADVLKFDFRALHAGGRPLRICGNLPYNISTPVLFQLLAARDCLADLHFMLQKEVVLRMAAAPGGRTYGRLTVMLAAACRVEPLFQVGRGAFQPPPAVDSMVVRLVPHPAPPFPIPDPVRFERLVAAAFSARRKTLRNALRRLIGPQGWAETGIDPGRRPETLAPAEFAALAALPAAAADPL
ncbi:MAG: 16S rRNA (adenine(1518)-N(6)/adenine(1519)-N(6))-dimethyltransferase RsmA [Gammaproteobacteria bacterium]|nr:16S rRNA (adenine(1518)-N(6)/adenine(1519)-N(6))-dimethyltransferase RsmA [Gammaproteobacteria bacterium]